MKKIFTSIFSTVLFLTSGVTLSGYASDLTIPANSNCEVRLSNSENKENEGTAFISCELTNKVDNKKVTQLYVRINRKHTGVPSPYSTLNSNHSYSSPIDTIWGRFSNDTWEKSI